MVVQDGIAGSAAVAGWSEALGELHERIGHRFARSEARERTRRYLVGLLGRVERKNGWRTAGDSPRPSERPTPRACRDCSTPPNGTRTRFATTCAPTWWSTSPTKR